MKKFSFIIWLLFLAVSLSAGGFRDKLAASLAPASSKYMLKVKGFSPSSKLPEEPSLWDSITSFFSSEEKEQKQRALADYIYNVYIIESAKGLKQSPAYLDTSYTGALDPIYRSSFKNAAEINSFYDKNLEAVNTLLKEDFKKLNYNPAAAENAKRFHKNDCKHLQ